MQHDQRATGSTSLALAGVLVSFALAGLALDANWLKLVRVLAAALAYGAVLAMAVRLAAPRAGPGAGLPFVAFGAAGAAAGLTSALLHPARGPALIAASALGAAALIGGLHWVALCSWRRLRARVAK